MRGRDYGEREKKGVYERRRGVMEKVDAHPSCPRRRIYEQRPLVGRQRGDGWEISGEKHVDSDDSDVS